MSGWKEVVLFLILGAIAGLFSFAGLLTGPAIMIAKLLFYIFVMLFIVSFVGRLTGQDREDLSSPHRRV